MTNYKYLTILDNILSLFIKIILLFKKENKLKIISNNILLVKMAEQGTNTYLIDYISELKKNYVISFLCLKGQDELIRLYHPDINFIIINNIKDFLSFLFKREEYQTIYSLDQKRSFSSLLVFKKYCNLIGFFNFESEFYTTLPIYNTRHISSFYEEMFNLKIAKQIISDESLKKEKIIIYPNIKDQLVLRKWPIDYYFKLVEFLEKNIDCEIEIIGVPSEKFLLENYFPNNKVSCELSMAELLEKYNESKYQITSDCGVAHFASLKGVKQIVLFGPENKNFMLPINAIGIQSRIGCSPCFSVDNNCVVNCNLNECMQTISPEEVFFRFLDLRGEFNDSKKKI